MSLKVGTKGVPEARGAVVYGVQSLVGFWCQSASAQLSVSPVALQAVEAAAAELALESPPGHLHHVIQKHGECLLIAGARASPVHAEEVQGGGTCGLKPTRAPVQVLLDLYVKEDTRNQTLSYLLKKAKLEKPAAPELPEPQHLHHAHAEHQEDPEGGEAGVCRGLGGALHLESGHFGQQTCSTDRHYMLFEKPKYSNPIALEVNMACYKILAFAIDRVWPEEQQAGLEVLAMNSCITCACLLHSPITLDSFTVPVTLA
ncbi:hypothetical protein MG293_020849 [Ovis ammon polii]|uniref:Uncharacterized protein n=1 Tax=Ovis ammon polii TaxID=230172 RepID=A0AAD4TPB6_OVIAM|nr:hypothetical protein MG293_020849 [Ovis ammon polii]